jgi:L-alanine-DL-glutamate epimerase-like enolase superfamily enzyme
LHVLACLPPTSLRANDLSTVLEADTTENPLVDLFAVNSLKIEAGQVQLPEGPGLGIDMEGIIRAAHLDPVWACETQSRH